VEHASGMPRSDWGKKPTAARGARAPTQGSLPWLAERILNTQGAVEEQEEKELFQEEQQQKKEQLEQQQQGQGPLTLGPGRSMAGLKGPRGIGAASGAGRAPLD